ncbi:MAG: FAD-dependent monooxygenase [Gammaproteobacteria bacterium]|nr:FAD-dependent monooxygenase [Gammaproteobacteria bacterium]
MRQLKCLIVGAGPVGLTLAKELHYFGITPRLIEKSAEPAKESRALALWSRTLEHLALRGEIDEFLAQGLKMTAIEAYSNGINLFKLDFGRLATPYPFALIVPQSQTEKILTAHLKKWGGVIERGVELRAYEMTDRGIEVVLWHHDTQQEEKQCVDYLFGCDGAHSLVRHSLNLNFQGSQEEETWILADVEVNGPLSRSTLSSFFSKKGAMAFIPLPDGQVRLFTSRGRIDDRPVSLEEFQTYVDEACPFKLTLSNPTWMSPFKINERVSNHYHVGRVVLLGDAAHVHSPAGGQGMNTGMQDAINLAWKVAEIEKGGREDILLSSYALERRHVGKEVVERAARMTHMIMMKNRLLIKLRNFVFPRLVKLPKIIKALTESMAEISIFYKQSPLVIRPKDHPGYPGTRLLEGLLDGVSLYSRCIVPQHTLLVFGGRETDHKVLLKNCPFPVNLVPVSSINLGLYQCYRVRVPTWILIRPDQYIAARGGISEMKSLKQYFREVTLDL